MGALGLDEVHAPRPPGHDCVCTLYLERLRCKLSDIHNIIAPQTYLLLCYSAEGAVHYYQGLHDVASVLLLVAGELPAFDMLCRLATGHLRDATRPSLDPVIELLGLMGPIVETADPELAQFINKQGLPPFYALSWFITWFSHDLKDLGEVMVPT